MSKQSSYRGACAVTRVFARGAVPALLFTAQIAGYMAGGFAAQTALQIAASSPALAQAAPSGAPSTAPSAASGALRDPGESHGVKLGLKAAEMTTDDWGDLACGSNGGPPRQPLDEWKDFGKCRLE